MNGNDGAAPTDGFGDNLLGFSAGYICIFVAVKQPLSLSPLGTFRGEYRRNKKVSITATDSAVGGIVQIGVGGTNQQGVVRTARPQHGPTRTVLGARAARRRVQWSIAPKLRLSFFMVAILGSRRGEQLLAITTAILCDGTECVGREKGWVVSRICRGTHPAPTYMRT